jgi:hypothetical protein
MFRLDPAALLYGRTNLEHAEIHEPRFVNAVRVAAYMVIADDEERAAADAKK